MNIVVILLTGLVPLVVGGIWYNPRVLGTAWMKASGVTPDAARSANLVKIFSLVYVLSVLLASTMYMIAVHQSHLMSLIMDQPDYANPASEAGKWYADTMARYGESFRTFKHGMLHGFITGTLLSFPIIGIPALFESRKASYIFINAGYWVVSITLMGGVVCQFG